MVAQSAQLDASFTKRLGVEDGKFVLSFGGELELASRHLIDGICRRLGMTGDVSVDLGGVTFLGISEAVALRGVQDRFHGMARDMSIRNATGVVARVLELVGGARGQLGPSGEPGLMDEAAPEVPSARRPGGIELPTAWDRATAQEA